MARAAAKRGARKRDAGGFAEGLGGRLATEVMGLSVLGLALLSTLALASYSPDDPLMRMLPVANRAGVVGASIAGVLYGVFGYGAAVLVGAAAWIGGRLVLGRGLPPAASRFWPGTALLLVSIAALPAVLRALAPARLGGAMGGQLGDGLASLEILLLSSWGALLLNGFLLLLGILSVSGLSLGTALAAVGKAASETGAATWRVIRRVSEAITGVVLRASELAAEWTGGLARAVAGAASAFVGGLKQRFTFVSVWRERRARRERVAAAREPEAVAEEVASAPPAIAREEEVAPEPDALPQEVAAASAPGPAKSAKGGAQAEPFIVDHSEDKKAKKPVQEAFVFEESPPRDRPFVLPETAIFQDPPEDVHKYDRDSLLMNSKILEKKLADFGVNGKVVRVHPGPVITMYEYEPASGIKVSKITNLNDDLAMALRALSIRIIAPLPGKSVVGIEVPNPERETVYLRTLLDAPGFRRHRSKLAVAMGKDIFGNPVESDLAKMPHLLVAGATGTGKSVFLNSFLCSLLCRATPDQLKFLLIDPKLLELSIYEGIPHLIADVVTNPKRAAAALAGVVRKMEERYQMMSAQGVRNVDQFNERVAEALAEGTKTFRLRPKPGEEEGQEVPFQHQPYIVVVIDELADLMVLAAKDVEESLQRLAQMARAAGIHLVLATQRPSVDVLTGVIKANFPARVSFQVSSAADSRVILDQKGSESLLGQGDMLFLPPGTSVIQRLHGPFVSEKEVADLVRHWREQGQPEFDEQLERASREGLEESSTGSGEDVDEMFDQAVAIVAETRNASISYVQRRLKIGYNRAARIIEHMENEGMVGQQVGTRPRDVFLPPPDEE